MLKLVLTAFAFGLVAACGGGGSGDDITLLDGGGLPTCNPVTQAGCDPGERCTWIVDQLRPQVGHTGCAAEANPAIPVGGADCFADGGLGPDKCTKGAVCIANECKTICDPQVSAAASGCDAQHACSRYSSTFVAGGAITAGACDRACDPLTQRLLDSTGTEACGSTDPAKPNKGCYTFNFEVFSCGPVDNVTDANANQIADQLELTDGTLAQTDQNGTEFVNGCAPGWIPFFFARTGSMITTCTGMCAPVKTDRTSPAGVSGSATALAKLPLEPAPAMKARCQAGEKGIALEPDNDQNCKFLWIFRLGPQNQPSTSRFNDTLGLCFNYKNFTFDATSTGGSSTQPIKSCAVLEPKGSSADPIYKSAERWGCYSLADTVAASATGAPGVPEVHPAMRDFHVGLDRNGSGKLYRYVIR